MAVTTITNLLVNSWAGSNNGYLIGSNAGTAAYVVRTDAATLSASAPSLDSTAFAADVVSRTALASIQSWTVGIEARIHPASNGGTGLVTYANGYAVNVNSWTLSLQWEPNKSTAYDTGGVTTESFIPGLMSGTGTYTAYADDTTDLVLPGGSTDGTATFKIVEDGSQDMTLAADVFVTQLSVPYKVGSVAQCSYSIMVNGDVTAGGQSDGATGTYTTNPWNYWIANSSGIDGDGTSGTIGTPVAGSLVLAHPSGNISGSAFLSAWSISNAIGQIPKISMTAQGSGALTVA